MAVLRRRSKMISFRISEEEYENFVSLCASHGVRSLSDLARDALQRMLLTDRPATSTAEPDVVQLRGRVAKLEGEIQRLTHLVDRPDAHHQPNGNGDVQ